MKCGQFYDATIGEWTQCPQGGLTTDQYTNTNAATATKFCTIKAANDDMFVYCGGMASGYPIMLKITPLMVITKTEVLHILGSVVPDNFTMMLSKDNKTIFLQDIPPNLSDCRLISMSADFSSTTTPTLITLGTTRTDRFSIFKDFYIWVASGGTVKIYDYMTKVELASVSVVIPNTLCIIDEDTAVTTNGGEYNCLQKLTFDANLKTLTTTFIGSGFDSFEFLGAKQLLMDPYGDLICLKNNDTGTLSKYTATGTKIGTTITLAAQSYNLAIDTKGNYYYQTAFATYKIPKNDAAGQPFHPDLTKPIRGTGNVGYGSNMTGYQPSVYA